MGPKLDQGPTGMPFRCDHIVHIVNANVPMATLMEQHHPCKCVHLFTCVLIVSLTTLNNLEHCWATERWILFKLQSCIYFLGNYLEYAGDFRLV